MLWPTHVISAAHRTSDGSSPVAYLTNEQVYLHTRHINADIVVHPTGQPLKTFLQDNNQTRPAYARNDIITITACLNGSPLPPVTQFTVDDIDSRGHLFGPYVELQLTAAGRV